MGVTIFSLPITNAALGTVVALLIDHDVFTPSWDDSAASRYDLGVYLREQQEHGISTTFLVDRNVFGRLVALAKGAEAQDAHRTAAAIMAFAQCCEGALEPNIALYELAQQNGNDAAVDELATFRRADHTHPALWAEVARGSSHTLAELAEPPPPQSHDGLDFMMSLRDWNRNYIMILTLAVLELEGGNALARMLRFMDWGFNSFSMRGPAILLAAHYLAPGARRAKLLKNLRSPDRDLALKGLKNAAWDVTYISEWQKRFNRYEAHNEATVLVSMDKAIHTLARATIDPDRDPTAVAERTLMGLWGERDGRQIAGRFAEYYASRDNPRRQINRPSPEGYLSLLVEDGEALVRAWRPRL